MQILRSVILWVFYILPDFLGYVLAAAGLAVVIVPEALKSLEDRKVLRTFVALFLIVIGIGAVISNRIQQSHESDDQRQAAKGFQDKIDKLDQSLRAEEVSHTGDVKFLEGELRVFGQFAPAIMELARASELSTRKQYEQKVLSNKGLADFVAQVVKKMRDWEYRKDMAENELENQQMAESSQIYAAQRDDDPKSPQGVQMQQQVSKIFTDYIAKERELELKFQNDFQQNILADAVSAKEQLINRLGAGAEPQLEQINRSGLLVFQGTIVGYHPVAVAANYLEIFGKKLTP